jgi:regulator of nucleoside diphosphate kinase
VPSGIIVRLRFPNDHLIVWRIERCFVIASCVILDRDRFNPLSWACHGQLAVKDMLDDLQTRLPAIAISARDIDRLRHLAEAAMEKYPATAEFLAREIDRAEIIPADRPSGNVVTMQSQVTFIDDISGQKRTVTLVYPEEANVDAGKISVLTPIGAALIGLSAGQSIEFQTPSGGWRSLTALAVGSSWPASPSHG